MSAITLQRPQFIERDPVQINNDLTERYEQLTGKRLYPGQPERLMLDFIVYVVVMTRINFQHVAEQNTIQYALGEILEHLALFFDVTRKGALKATTTLRFTADNDGRVSAIIIPAGTQIRSNDYKQTFVTLEGVVLELSDTFKDVAAEALSAGAAANGYPPGTITETLTTIAFLESVSNTTITQNGADVETDEQLRERTKKAPESFSVAGPTGAYEFWALSAHPSIIDVAIDSSLPGRVEVYPLTTDGLPSQEVLDAVTEILNDTKVRPLTDTVSVVSPVQRAFSITAAVTLFTRTPSIETKNEIEKRLTEFTDKQRLRLGRDIVPNQIISIIQTVPGVYNVSLSAPATLVSVMQNEFADCTAITINLETPVNEEPIT